MGRMSRENVGESDAATVPAPNIERTAVIRNALIANASSLYRVLDPNPQRARQNFAGRQYKATWGRITRLPFGRLCFLTPSDTISYLNSGKAEARTARLRGSGTGHGAPASDRAG